MRMEIYSEYYESGGLFINLSRHYMRNCSGIVRIPRQIVNTKDIKTSVIYDLGTKQRR
jgi:hypothetical protein